MRPTTLTLSARGGEEEERKELGRGEKGVREGTERVEFILVFKVLRARNETVRG